MPRACTVCTHPERQAIDRALVGGEAARTVASRYVTPSARMAVQRHGDNGHIAAKLSQAQAAREVVQADDLLAQLRGLRSKALQLLLKAEAAGDLRTALMGVREARATIELLAEMEGELDRRPTVNLLVAPEWLAVRSAVLVALNPYPEARIAVAASLVALAGSNGARG